MNLSKYKGKSFADVAEIISKKYKNRDNDPLQMRSFKMEITALRNAQEAVRPKEDTDIFVDGGPLGSQLDKLMNQSQFDFSKALPTFNFAKPLVGTNKTEATETPTISDTNQNNLSFQAQSTLNKGMFDVDQALARMKSKDLSSNNLSSIFNSEEPRLGVEAEPDKVEKEGGLKRFLKDNVYAPLVAGKGIEALGKGLMLAGGYDKVDPNYNPNEQDIRNLMEGQGIDTQAIENKILSQQEAAMANTGNVRSTAAQQALQQAIYSQTSDALSNLGLQNQQLRNAIASQSANTLNQLGQQRVQAENIAEQLNAQSKAGFQQSIVNMLESAGATGEEITKAKAGMISETIVANLMSTGNFYVDPACKPQSGYFDSSCIQPIKSRDVAQTGTGVDRTESLGNATDGLSTETSKKKDDVESVDAASTSTSTKPVLNIGLNADKENIINNENVVDNTPTTDETTTNEITTDKVTTDETVANEEQVSSGFPSNFKNETEAVGFMADKILSYEQSRGSSTGTGLSQYSDPKYKTMLTDDIYPEITKIMPNASLLEKVAAMDFVFNSGWDEDGKTITKDPRGYAIQEYYRKYDKSKLDKNGKWKGRTGDAYSFDAEYEQTVGKLPENERRELINQARDWVLKNTFKDKNNTGIPGVDYWSKTKNPDPNKEYIIDNGYFYERGPDGSLSPAYGKTWYGRIQNVSDYEAFDPDNPNFKIK